LGSRSSERGRPDWRPRCRRDRLHRRGRAFIGAACGRHCLTKRSCSRVHSTTTASAYCVDAEGVASSEGAIQNISKSFDYDWVNQRVGAWVEAYFDHDYIFVFDRNDRMVYSLADHRPADTTWLASARPGLNAVIDFMRGRVQSPP